MMGENSEDDIVVTRRQDASSDSSDIMIVPSVSLPSKQSKSKRKSSISANRGLSRNQADPEKDHECTRNPKRPKSSSVCCKEGLCKVRVIDRENENVVYLRNTDTLEKIHNEFCREDPQSRMKYRSTFVSKYLTLEEIGFNEETDWIVIHRPQKGSEDVGMMKLKVNVDRCRTVELSLDECLTMREVLSNLERTGFHGNILIRNGVVIDLGKRIKNVLGPGDVLDLIDLAEVLG